MGQTTRRTPAIPARHLYEWTPRPQFGPVIVFQAPAIAANPVIPLLVRQLEELDKDYTAALTVRPQYIKHSAFPFDLTYPVIPISLRKLSELDQDYTGPFAARPQYVKHSSFPFALTYPVIPILTRRLEEMLVAPLIGAHSEIRQVPAFPFDLTYPVIPILLRRLEELGIEPLPIRPQFLPLFPFTAEEEAAASPVIAFLRTTWQERDKAAFQGNARFLEFVKFVEAAEPEVRRRLWFDFWQQRGFGSKYQWPD